MIGKYLKNLRDLMCMGKLSGDGRFGLVRSLHEVDGCCLDLNASVSTEKSTDISVVDKASASGDDFTVGALFYVPSD